MNKKDSSQNGGKVIASSLQTTMELISRILGAPGKYLVVFSYGSLFFNFKSYRGLFCLSSPPRPIKIGDRQVLVSMVTAKFFFS